MTVAAAVDLLLALLLQVQRVSAMIKKAREEGRDGLSDDEVDELAAADDEARAEFRAAIDRARAEGR